MKEVWGVALSNDGQHLAGTTHDGHIKVWDLSKDADQLRDIETKGSFGMCIDMVCRRLLHVVAVSRTDTPSFI